jgi:hypothetical protein
VARRATLGGWVGLSGGGGDEGYSVLCISYGEVGEDETEVVTGICEMGGEW